MIVARLFPRTIVRFKCENDVDLDFMDNVMKKATENGLVTEVITERKPRGEKKDRTGKQKGGR